MGRRSVHHPPTSRAAADRSTTTPVTPRADSHGSPKPPVRYAGRYTATATTPPSASAYNIVKDVPDASRSICRHRPSTVPEVPAARPVNTGPGNSSMARAA